MTLHAGVSAAKPVSVAAVRHMLEDGGEIALVDVREELTFSQNHLLWARNVPLSRLDIRFARLVPRKDTRIVLCDDNDGLAARAAAILARGGYTDIACLDGGVPAWEKAGFVTFSGVHVPSKAFGEFVEHDSSTPSIGATELDALMKSGAKMVVLDSRPFDEYTRVSIPGGINVPGAELVLRVRDIAPSPDTIIVVNCAGRTRSIIGAQSLINAGVPNRVMALRNGTMGWHLAGLTCASGKTDRAPDFTRDGLAWAKPAAKRVAGKFGVAHADRATVERWRQDKSRTTYVFDVRDPAEYIAGHYPGATSAPGGQLVQATDLYAGTLGARIVVSDDAEVRALMTASWLRQMGWKDVFVLAEAGDEKDMPAPILLGTPAMDRAIEPAALEAMSGATVIDLSASPRYRRGHIPGAWFAIRSRLDRALAAIAPAGPVVLTCEDGTLAGLAATDAQALTGQPVHWLKGGNAAWQAAGLPLSAEEKMADEPVDVWLKPYERANDNEAAMNAYLSWEVDLLDRIEQDGTTHFVRG
ncbi:MAG: thiosulfate sulfurtransferase [Pseudolabrys sp.]|jgi:rhodanese-related sulfurtransferase|nr:thiosulfate sulfurtransferase [Pseudolabrys sp.]